MVKILPFNPRDKEIERIFNCFMQMDINFPRSTRTTPSIANKLSKYKTIRHLTRLNYMDIVGKNTRGRRSIIYLEPKIAINKKGKGILIKIP